MQADTSDPEDHGATLPAFYTPAEERLNIVTHFIGLVLSIVGLVLLVMRAAGSSLHVVSVAIYGASLVALYAASTIYHGAKHPACRMRLRTVDHAAIYVLIAGTYTPFSLLVLPDRIGWVIFGAAWGMAAVGITLKLFFTGRFNLVSTLTYVFMGWIIVFAIRPLLDAFAGPGMAWLVAGGILYTVGALFYSSRKLPFGHAVFHVFVVAGSITHFVAVYEYVLPPG